MMLQCLTSSITSQYNVGYSSSIRFVHVKSKARRRTNNLHPGVLICQFSVELEKNACMLILQGSHQIELTTPEADDQANAAGWVANARVIAYPTLPVDNQSFGGHFPKDGLLLSLCPPSQCFTVILCHGINVLRLRFRAFLALASSKACSRQQCQGFPRLLKNQWHVQTKASHS